MRNIRHFLFFIVLSLFLFNGCEKEYSWNIKSDRLNAIVVDGIITNENKAQCIKLSLINHELNSDYTILTGASVAVNDSTENFIFTESGTEPGSYFSVPFQGVVGKKYTLTITYNSVSYTAKAHMVPITPLEAIKLSTKNGLYKYDYIKSNDPSMLEVYLNWSAIPAYSQAYGDFQAQETFYTLNNVDANSAFGPEKETIYFPAGTVIIRRKYSLSAEHQAFLRSLLMETEWRGGIFDVQQGNVLTNMSNGALGFFGACMVLSDTTFVK